MQTPFATPNRDSGQAGKRKPTRKPGRKSKATIFTAQKFRWLEQVERDCKNMPPLAVAVAVEFCHYFDLAHDGAAWPWQDAIANALNVKRESVNRLITILVKRGHLLSTRRGRDQSNLYHMVPKETADQPQKQPAAKPPRCDRTRTSSTPMMCAQDVTDQRLRCDRSVTQTPFKTPGGSNEPPGERERRCANAHDNPRCRGVP
jgi:hypothetical protein